jgi:hypothetical protein
MDDRRIVAAALACLALAGCGGEPSTPREPFSELRLGTVDAMGQGFYAIAEDLDLAYDPNPGGFRPSIYTPIKYHLRGYAAGSVTATKSIVRTRDGLIIYHGEDSLALPAPAGDGTWEPADPEHWTTCVGGVKRPNVADERIRVQVDMKDPGSGDILATASAETTARCALAVCTLLCTGDI